MRKFEVGDRVRRQLPQNRKRGKGPKGTVLQVHEEPGGVQLLLIVDDYSLREGYWYSQFVQPLDETK